MAARSESEQAAAREPKPKPTPAPSLDPQLLMAARRGDSKRIKELLLEVVIVDVAPDDGPPPAAAPPPGIGVTLEGDTLLHVVAACGDGDDFIDCANTIAGDKKRKGGAAAVRLALEARNNKGETPLHCAARAGNAHMISCLVGLLTDAAAAGDKEAVKTKFLGMKNTCEETALHQAVRAGSKAVIDELLKVDPGLECSSRVEDAGAAACSPFFLAVSLWGDQDDMDIARHLFDKTSPSIRSNLYYYCSGGPDGRNVLHAAVSRGSVKTVVLLSQLLTSAGCLLLSQLASQRDKENGSTPIHLAASLDGLPSSWLILPPHVLPPAPETTPLWPSSCKCTFWFWWFPTRSHRRSCTADAASKRAHLLVARPILWGPRYWQILPLMPYLVLNANEDMAYQPDKEGMYPIHVAAGSGSLLAVEMLLERCPDCATLRDAKGRTLLHVAAEEGRWFVVNYVCRQSQLKLGRRWCYMCPPRRPAPAEKRLAELLSSILNAQDINGDTALHRAVQAAQVGVVRRLIGNHQVRLDIPNNKGMRPIDVSWTTLPLQAYYAWDFRILIRKSLLRFGAPHGENNRGDLFRKKCVLTNQEKEKMSEKLTVAAQVLALFSVLITTVTFASAFTLPGGSRSAGDVSSGGVAGTPVFGGPRRSYAFDAFILADALAFGLSLVATSLLLYVGVPAGTLEGRFYLINFAYGLMWHSARSLLAAFGLGLFIVLLPVARSIAIAVAFLMILLALVILKECEGLNSWGDIPMVGIGCRSRQLSPRDLVLGWILWFFNLFWSYVLIFGIPAIRRWPKFTLSPY